MTRPTFMAGLDTSAIAAPMHFDREEYDRLIIEHGSSGQWWPAILCPCARLETRNAASSCPICRGKSHIYPIELRQPVMVLDTSRTATLKWATAGLITQGQITLTWPCGIVPGIGDLILPDGDQHVVTQRLFHRATVRVPDSAVREERSRFLSTHRRPQYGSRNERLLYPSEDVCIEAAYRVEDDRLLRLHPGQDFTLGPENSWLWRDGREPEEGTAWTVRYRATAAYMIRGSAPLLRREGDQNMPYRTMAERLDRVAADDLRGA